MPSIDGLTNPFENSILNSNLTQLEKEKQIANYSSALSQGYEPPAEVLTEIAALLDAGVLSPEAVARLEELTEQIMAEIGPIITSDGGGDTASIIIDENSTVVTTIAALDQYSSNDSTEALSYSIVGGVDASLFQINAITGELTFIAPPDYELPVGGDNIYEVTVQVNDGATLLDTQTITVAVADLNDTAPVITSVAEVTIDENTTAVTTVTSDDPDTVGGAAYSISGGADAAMFQVNAVTGELSFIAAPDFETPADADNDNIYDVIVQVDDGVQTDTQSFTIDVRDVLEGPPLDEIFILTEGNDSHTIDSPNNTGVYALGGNDYVVGDAYNIYDGRSPSPVRLMGDDFLDGAGGADQIYGDAVNLWAHRSWYLNPTFDAGDDYINGGADNDRLFGDFNTISADSNNYGGFTVIGGNDVMSGDAGSDFMVGDADRISISARGGIWRVEGGDDTMNGGDDNDTIYGDFKSSYVNTYRGSGSAEIANGNDRINGGAGNDVMYGDSGAYAHYTPTVVTNGADTFVFNDNSGNDTIRDFQSGLDTIEVDGYGLTDFTQLDFSTSGGHTTVHFDASNSVTILNVIGLNVDDFAFV